MNPRQLVHRGTIHTAGFWIDESIVGTALTRRRILEMPGVDEVRRMLGGLFVRLRSPLWIATDRAIGVPLVVCRGVLLGAPLDPDELDDLAAPSDSVVLVRGGETLVIAPESCPREDLASWIDLSDWIAEPVTSLGVVWTSPRAAPAAKDVDPRKIAGIGPATKEAEALATALSSGRPMDLAPKPKGFASSVLTSLSAFLSSIAARLGRRPNRALNPPAQNRSLVAQPAPQARREDWSERLRMALNTAAARLLVWARLASWVGRRQADYLEKTLSMFDSGDLDDALRHAIPLGTGSGNPKPFALSVPTPRADLSIHTKQTEASSTLGFGENVYEALRQRYRKAVEQLEKQGRIKEAAFVLAELLGASEEAVSFLEKHHEYQLAAELAEGRYLDPALVVRQWILAGDRDRAVLIARRTGAFAAAIARLEPSHPEQAAVLRVLWANQLAASGAYGAAVQTIWPVEGARHLAHDWIDRGIAIGGAVGARLLATKAWLLPDEFGSVVEIVKALPRDETDDAVDTWRALALSVLANPTSKTMQILARASLRALLGHSNDHNGKLTIDRLATMTADPVLLADIRRQSSHEGPALTVRFRVGALSDTGLARTVNEDGYCMAIFEKSACVPYTGTTGEQALPARGALFAVADGMGGYHATDVVNLAFDTIKQYLQTMHPPPFEVGQHLALAVEEASVAVYRKAVDDRTFAGSGATITAAWLMGDLLSIAQVGDTRGYIYRDGRLHLITKDHSLINELMDAGKLTASEIASFEHKNVITRALGTVERVKVDVYRFRLLDKDRILLCTDGVHGMIDHKQIQDGLRRAEDAHGSRPEFAPQTACDILKKQVLEAGAHDNLAMVIVDVRIQNGAPVNSREVVAPLIEVEETVKAEPEKRLITRSAADTGAMHVYDAVVLPGGRLLVALGEAGVRMLSPEGKTIVHFDEPATRIVISDHGDRAIVVAQRGETSRTARIDLVKRRAERWFDATLEEFADSFDGSTWFVSNAQGVFVIDALEEIFQSIWEMKDLGCRMGARTSSTASFRNSSEAWTLDLPSFRLRSRSTIPISEGISWTNLTLGSRGTAICWLGDEATGTYAPALHHAPATTWDCLDERVARGELSHVTIDDFGSYGAFGRVIEDGCASKVFDLREKKLRLEFQLDGATKMHARFQSGNVIVADDRGRVIVVNIERSKIVNEWRI